MEEKSDVEEFWMRNGESHCSLQSECKIELDYLKSRRELGGQGTGRSGPESLEDDDRIEEISAPNRYTLKQSSYI